MPAARVPASRVATSHVTMQDVAERAGVSAQTVSNVINGRTAHVGADTIDRVTRVIDELGYRLNQSARSLRRGRTGIVGLGVPVLTSAYYGELAERLSLRFSSRGIRLVTENTGGGMATEVESLAASHLETYDGFILAVAASVSADLDRILPNRPIVLLGERALSTRFDHVVMDNVAGGALATGALLDRGARAVVALGGAESGAESVQTLRTHGYLEAHRERGLPARTELIVNAGLDMADGFRAVSRLIDDGIPFDGIFALTDSTAFGALRALADRGMRVPVDVQVVGFDNLRASDFTTPRLSTIEPGNDEMADEIADIMLTRLRSGGQHDPARYRMPRPVLVARETTL